MSYEPTLYSPVKNSITFETLINEVESAGWSMAFFPFIQEDTPPPTRSDIICNGELYGWKKETFTQEEAERLFTLDHDQEIEEKLAEGLIGNNELYVENDFSIEKEFLPEEIEEIIEECGIDFVNHLRAAKSTFTPCMMGNSSLSIEFHELLSTVLQKLAGGIFDEG